MAIPVERTTAPPACVPPLLAQSARAASLHEALLERGFLTPDGKVVRDIPLPPLPYTPREHLQGQLDAPVQGTSISELLTHVQGGVHVIGGYAAHLIFTPEYVQEVLESLGVAEYFDPRLCAAASSTPPDIDLRAKVPLKPGQKHLEVTDFEEMGRELSANIRVNPGDAYDTYFTFYTWINRFFLLSLKGNPFDLTLYDALERDHVFTVDALHLQLDSKMLPPASLEPFLHYLLGWIVCENPQTVDKWGWHRYISWLGKGYRPLSSDLGRRLYKGNVAELETWLAKHSADDVEARFAFYFNAAFQLQSTLEGVDLPVEVAILRKVPLDVLEALFKVSGYQRVHVEIDEEEAVRRLAHSDHPELIPLFFRLYQPHKLSCRMDVLSRSPSPFLNCLASLLSTVPKAYVEARVRTLLPLHPTVATHLEGVVGTIPDPSSPTFRVEWVTTLFEPGRGSEEVAYKEWKALHDEEADMTVSYPLIRNVAQTHPEIALRMVAALGTLTPLLLCAQALSRVERKSREHNALCDYCVEQLPQHLEEPEADPKLLSSGLFWFAKGALAKNKKFPIE